MFRDIQIVIITNCVVVSSVGIKRVDCANILCSSTWTTVSIDYFSVERMSDQPDKGLLCPQIA